MDQRIPAQIASPCGAHVGSTWASPRSPLKSHRGICVGFTWGMVLLTSPTCGDMALAKFNHISGYAMGQQWAGPGGAHVGFEWDSPSPCKSHGPTVAHGNPRRDLDGLAIWVAARSPGGLLETPPRWHETIYRLDTWHVHVNVHFMYLAYTRLW